MDILATLVDVCSRRLLHADSIQSKHYAISKSHADEALHAAHSIQLTRPPFRVAESIAAGSQFALYEGRQQVALGRVDEVEEVTLD
jgi:hypothetical protein